ncbi:MAG TPA: DNA mismatch repair endonuclease MutL [bacterium]|nr:DNA mismatch repair endonuclease MutL [bacterium]
MTSAGRIRRLPEDLISKIAAGEVIERPFSVVKELVENSIDAGAANIEIDVEEGGRKRLVILDDGIGMTREEALLALERHATSKLPNEEALFKIRTLGFRGEAVPSIAAVSFMTLESRSREAEEGARIEIEGGKIVKTIASSIARGTRISIQNLFFNTPARLKFLKSKETEFSHIASWIESIALSRFDIGFTLRHNGKTELFARPQTEAKERIREILGADIAEYLHAVEGRRGQLSVKGFVTDHRASATSAKSLFFFVNGRIVRDRTLQHAVLSAYENLMMKHRYPWAVLYLDVPPEFVDVNVHPTKSEVRFANGSLVHELVRESVRGVLGAGGKAEEVQSPMSNVQSLEEVQSQSSEISDRFGLGSLDFGPQTNPFTNCYRIIGQVHGTYLLCETDEKLLLIDQHAAHERIGFEKLHAQFENGGIEKQHLLIPQNFDLRPSQGEILKKYLDDLANVGLEVEFFGGNTFILRTIPTLLDGSDVVSLIEELIDSLEAVGKLTPLEEKIHEVLERMACHAQVRAGQRLTNEEIEALIGEMGRTKFAGQCPHGRPSVLEVPFNEIEKWFKRRL